MDINDIKNHINNKSRLIGVDMGSKRVGLSISDENRKIATPLKTVNYENIIYAFYLNGIYLVLAITLFYYSFGQARKRGTLINIGCLLYTSPSPRD